MGERIADSCHMKTLQVMTYNFHPILFLGVKQLHEIYWFVGGKNRLLLKHFGVFKAYI